MRNAGALLMIIGALLALMAYIMETSVHSSGTFIGGELVGGGSTHNLGLLQQQMMVLHTGLAAFVAGAFFFGSGGTGEAEHPMPTARQRTGFRDEETEEEREDRLAGVKRINRAMSALLITLVLAFIFLFRDELF